MGNRRSKNDCFFWLPSGSVTFHYPSYRRSISLAAVSGSSLIKKGFFFLATATRVASLPFHRRPKCLAAKSGSSWIGYCYFFVHLAGDHNAFLLKIEIDCYCWWLQVVLLFRPSGHRPESLFTESGCSQIKNDRIFWCLVGWLAGKSKMLVRKSKMGWLVGCCLWWLRE